MPTVRRLVPLAAVAALATVVSGCGGSGSAAVDHWLGPDAVVTRSVSTTTTPPVAEDTPSADGTTRTAQSQQYTVQRGDSVSKIANRCGVEMDALVGINDWGSANEAQLMPGDVIQVPPNGIVACGVGASSTASSAGDEGDDAAADSGDDDDDGGGSSSAVGKCEDGSDAETYTIADGDNPSKVASAHDVSLAELQAANEGNGNVMTKFIVGQELYLPC